jgi:hypothetical protein
VSNWTSCGRPRGWGPSRSAGSQASCGPRPSRTWAYRAHCPRSPRRRRSRPTCRCTGSSRRDYRCPRSKSWSPTAWHRRRSRTSPGIPALRPSRSCLTRTVTRSFSSSVTTGAAYRPAHCHRRTEFAGCASVRC